VQHCRAFNPAAFGDLTSRRRGQDDRVVLEHGRPIRFGADGRYGIALENMEPQVVDLSEDPAAEERLLVHNRRATSPAMAALLASLQPPDFPTALGIFRQIEMPTYESSLVEQIDDRIARRGRGDLGSLLAGGTSWEVDSPETTGP